MTIRSFLRNDGQFAQVDAGSISISTTTTTGFLTYITKATTADITMNSSSSYFDGPVVSQGSSGTWYVIGTVTLLGIAQTANVKLWDGSTVIASASDTIANVNALAVTLGGVIASPAGNLRMSCNSPGTTTKILFNQSGNSADSNITAIRIG